MATKKKRASTAKKKTTRKKAAAKKKATRSTSKKKSSSKVGKKAKTTSAKKKTSTKKASTKTKTSVKKTKTTRKKAKKRTGDPGVIRNIGPISLAWLHESGVYSVDELDDAGSVPTYRFIKERHPHASLNLLWSLEGAILDVARDEITMQRKAELLRELREAGPVAAVEEES